MFSANSSQVSDDKLFVEDVFSTYLYTGTSGSQTITNGIDLAGKGGLVWIKERSNGVGLGHYLFDTARGLSFALETDTTSAQANRTTTVNAFNSNGFSMGSGGNTNNNGTFYASWTFRKAPKFFDVVTWTGNGVENRAIPHALGSQPGFILLKATSQTSGWDAWHRSSSFYLGTAASVFCMGRLNETTALSGGYSEAQRFGAAPTSTNFTLGPNISGAPLWNASGVTYVAYLFAHDATSDGIIQCGSYTGNGAAEGPTVTLGWEPQWVMVKNASSTSSWIMVDNMRGMTANGDCGRLDANSSASEGATTGYPLAPNATGFQVKGATALNGSGQTSIYIAIRRGPMRTPTLGTSVFAPVFASGTAPTYTTSFVTDMAINRLPSSPSNNDIASRLTGTGNMATESTAAEGTDTANVWSYMNGWRTGSRSSYISWNFRRAPGFFDEVCYTGTGVARTVSHNLGVAPELMILKSRSGAGTLWYTYSSFLGIDKSIRLNEPDPAYSGFSGILNNTTPSATSFSLATNNSDTNGSGSTYVAYLFASCPGVSKVGSYTGNGSSQTINCGFAAGARFVMIKRTNAAGDWYVWDTARGIVAANDPHLSLNTTAAEVTTDDSVDTNSSGFVVNQVAATNVNVNAATYIYLAIA